jgi:hypothetical protein
MEMPFTVDQFFEIFKTYNTAIWPMQIVAYILGVICVVLAFGETGGYSRINSGILAFFWIWIGIVYHTIHFSKINTTAGIFGILFIFQGMLLFSVGTLLKKVTFRFSLKPLPIIGTCFIIYAMVIYPALSIYFGHPYPRSPVFGVAPCPTTIFTFGILLLAAKPVPGYLLIIPLLWSFVGMSAAVNLGVPQDYGLFVSGVLGTLLIVSQNRNAVSEKRGGGLLPNTFR